MKLVCKKKGLVEVTLAQGTFKVGLEMGNVLLDAIRQALEQGRETYALEFASELSINAEWAMNMVRRYEATWFED